MNVPLTAVEEKHNCNDAVMCRTNALLCWSDDVYGGSMANAAPITAWMRYLRDIQAREGWSIARIARESNGQIHKATLFRMMTGKTKRVPVDVVRLVAQIVGDEPDDVLSAVAGSIDFESDARLAGLDPTDPVVQKIMALDIEEHRRAFMLDRHRRIAALRREQDLAELEIIVQQDKQAPGAA